MENENLLTPGKHLHPLYQYFQHRTWYHIFHPSQNSKAKKTQKQHQISNTVQYPKKFTLESVLTSPYNSLHLLLVMIGTLVNCKSLVTVPPSLVEPKHNNTIIFPIKRLRNLKIFLAINLQYCFAHPNH